jgi:predicted dehydrogenase
MKLLVIGYGSIGARHARLAAALGCEVKVVSRNADCPLPRFETIARAFEVWQPDRVVVANETGLHFQAVQALYQVRCESPILVEKPIFMSSRQIPEKVLEHASTLFVAYNMRFHPAILALREWVSDQRLVSAAFTVGQFLPDWRPGTDYSKSYSASAELGGGVLRDLSHEVDLALWLCGPWQKVCALGGHFSELNIRSDDSYALIAQSSICSQITVSLNYLNRPAYRSILINSNTGTAHLDLMSATLSINGKVSSFELVRDTMYLKQLEAFIAGDASVLCSLSEGLNCLYAIEATENASREQTWQRPARIN